MQYSFPLTGLSLVFAHSGAVVDKQTLAVMIPVLIVLIPNVAIGFNGLQKVARLRIEVTRDPARTRLPERRA